jgi:hypothetical protein
MLILQKKKKKKSLQQKKSGLEKIAGMLMSRDVRGF